MSTTEDNIIYEKKGIGKITSTGVTFENGTELAFAMIREVKWKTDLRFPVVDWIVCGFIIMVLNITAAWLVVIPIYFMIRFYMCGHGIIEIYTLTDSTRPYATFKSDVGREAFYEFKQKLDKKRSKIKTSSLFQ